MFRNVESHFSQVPSVELPRSTFGRPFDHKTTFNVGDVIPLFVDQDILPGDTVKVTSSKVIRLQTLLTPIMDNIYFDTYWFFVPNRLVWSHWKEFCKENTSSAWIPQTEYQIPSISSPENGFDYGTLADYMGLPCKVEWDNEAKRRPSALPFRAYALIMNEFFRWTPVTDPLVIPMGDSNQTGSNGSNYITDVANGGKPFKAAKYFDYFTSCLPSPQRGPTVAFGTNPIVTAKDMPVKTGASIYNPNSYPLAINAPGMAADTYGLPYVYSLTGSDTIHYNITTTADTNIFNEDGTLKESPADSKRYSPVNLWADPANAISVSGVQFDINELRLAFQLQKFYERLALGGDRYQSVILSMFGVHTGDARLQRPEYLGGNRIPLSINEVTNTAQSAQDFLGDLGAKSATSDVHFDIDFSAQEHGILMCVGVCRYDHSYEGLNAGWSRRKFTDIYWPVFSNLGNLPVYDSEIYADADTIDDDTVFGYQEAWASYRYFPNRCSGEMRPSHPQTLASWNLCDSYSECPTLSDGWIREDKTNVDRALAVTSATSNQIFGDFFFDCEYTRVMPMYSVPGLIDHH